MTDDATRAVIDKLGEQPGENPTVEIKQVQQNVAFATIGEPDPRTL